MSQSRIGSGARVNGKLSFEKDLRICGEFSGTITGGELLFIDKDARVKAEIETKTLIIRGHVEGRIIAHNSITLEAGSVVHADIQTKDIHIVERAQYQGHCVTDVEQK